MPVEPIQAICINTPAIYETPFFAAIAGLLGGYLISIRVYNRQRRFEESAKFREVFFEMIIICERETDPDGEDVKISRVVDSEYITQKKAMLRFRPFINKSRLGGFDRAWEKYESKNGVHGKPVPGIREDHAYTQTDESEKRDIILSRVRKVLEYAPVK